MGHLRSYNPTTKELLAELPVTTTSEIDEMVKNSHRAQKSWGERPIEERAQFILKGYERLKENREEMVTLIHSEMGKTLKEAHREFDGYTGGIKNLMSEVIESLKPSVNNDGVTETTTYRDPLGVCASITPWNFPLGMPHTLMMPSLAAGNTIIFKPSEEVPLIGLKYVECLNQTLPKGVLQVVIGAGEQGKYLVESDVQLITFTGSQATGKSILSSGGKELKRVLLELGGKDPLIVLNDADVEKATTFAVNNSFRNAGQVCVSTEKIYVEEAIYDNFVGKLIEKAQNVELGHMIHHKQKTHVVNQVKEAIAEGAQIVFGELDESDSNYFSPVVLTDVTPEMNIMVDETFGPVACVQKVSSTEEAMELANRGNYALGGVIFSSDTEKAKTLSRGMKAGMVGINKAVGGAKGSPWVGAGQSGFGFHGSPEGHRQFTQLRIVSCPLNESVS